MPDLQTIPSSPPAPAWLGRAGMSLARWLLIGFVVVLLAGAAILAFTLSERQKNLVAQHEARAMQLAVAALRHAEQVFLHADLSLHSLDSEPTSEVLVLDVGVSDLHQHLRRLMVGSPIIEGIGFIGPDGRVRSTGDTPRPAATDLSDRDYFIAHRQSGVSDLLISEPLLARPSNTHAIPVSKRVETRDGRFAGVVAMRLRPQYFEEFFRSLGADVATLVRSDGVVLARHPEGGRGVGQRLGPDAALMQQVRQGKSGIYRTVSPIDGVARIAGYAVSERFPIITAVAFDLEPILADWRSERNRVVSFAVLLALLILAFGAFAVRRAGREASLAAQLAAAKAEAESARDEAEAASQAKSTFLSRMSHELRTPLNAILGFAQMLDRQTSLNKLQREFAQHINSAGHHLLNLVNEILDLSGIEAGRLRLSIERVVVSPALHSVIDTLTPLAEQAGIRLIAGHHSVPDIRADTQRLHQVLINLVSNAIKYNQKGGSVTINAVAAPGERVRIQVSDTGAGIAPERQAELFTPFNRLGAEFTGIEGTGIGLALSKNLVESMHGSIGFTSAAGRGSTFWIEFPVDSLATAPVVEPVPVAAFERPAPEAASGSFRVLYVEDNPANLRLVEHILAMRSDVTLLTAPSPSLGLDLARAHLPEVIVLDLHLPGMNGFELLARLKATPELDHTPILALSAAALPSDIKRGEAAGFFRYLTKPIDVVAFLAALDEALAARRRASPA